MRRLPDDVRTLLYSRGIQCRSMLAAIAYLNRMVGRSKPSLYRSAQRWRTATEEFCECCKERPRKGQLTAHCNTLRHICTLVGADYRDARRSIDLALFVRDAHDSEDILEAFTEAIPTRIEDPVVTDSLLNVARGLTISDLRHLNVELDNRGAGWLCRALIDRLPPTHIRTTALFIHRLTE